MANKIVIKRSAVSQKIPVAQDLDYGELAINYADGKLYYKGSDNTIKELTGGGGGGGEGGGTVVSVGITSSDLTVSNSPITYGGNISLSLNTVPVSKGGTGATTATDAITNLLPSQTTNSSKLLTTNGTTTSWTNVNITNQVHVAKNGNDTIGDGSINNPFLTVGAALTYLNTAYPVTSNSGENVVIYIGPGTYAETLTITRPKTHLVGLEGKSKTVRINGTVTYNPSVLVSGGLYETGASFTKLFISASSTSHALVVTGTIANTVEINECSLYTSGTGNALLVNNTAAGGNRLRVINTDINAVGNATAFDIINITNGVLNALNVSSASTADATRLTSSTLTLNTVLINTTTSTNCCTITGGVVNVGYSSLSSTKSNGNGFNITAGTQLVTGSVIYNIPLGTGHTVTGQAGGIYVFGGNQSVYGTNNSVNANITKLPMSSSINAADILGTVTIANGGTGSTTASGARTNLSAAASGANSDITSITGLTTALTVAQGGTGQTSFSSGYIKSNGTALSSSSTVSGSDVSGAVSSASAVSNTGAVNTNTDFYLPFVANNTTSAQALNTASNLKYNPNTDKLSVGTLNVNQGNISTVTLITTSTTADQIVDAVDGSTYRTVKYVIQVSSGNFYQTSELLVIHDSVTAYYTEFATITTGSSLASFNANYSAGNLQLRVTPVNAVTTIRAIRTCINV